jgi:hypothetical protein
MADAAHPPAHLVHLGGDFQDARQVDHSWSGSSVFVVVVVFVVVIVIVVIVVGVGVGVLLLVGVPLLFRLLCLGPVHVILFFTATHRCLSS